MAPGLTSVETLTSSGASRIKAQVPLSIFPDGIKTSGQHPPNYDELRAFEDFPDVIDGPTLWKAEDYRDNPERWVRAFPWQASDLSQIRPNAREGMLILRLPPGSSIQPRGN